MTISTLIAAFAVFGLIMAAMAVGVIFSNRRLQGSCGGLGHYARCVGRAYVRVRSGPRLVRGCRVEEELSTVGSFDLAADGGPPFFFARREYGRQKKDRGIRGNRPLRQSGDSIRGDDPDLCVSRLVARRQICNYATLSRIGHPARRGGGFYKLYRTLMDLDERRKREDGP